MGKASRKSKARNTTRAATPAAAEQTPIPQPATAVTALCNECDNADAVLECRHCECVLCAPCSSLIHAHKVLRHHELLPLILAAATQAANVQQTAQTGHQTPSESMSDTRTQQPQPLSSHSATTTRSDPLTTVGLMSITDEDIAGNVGCVGCHG